MDMKEILGYLLGYGIPLSALFVVLVIVIVAMGAATAWTRYIVLGLILVMLLIPQASNYGSIDGENATSSIFWVKGTKTFFFSFYDMALFGTWLLGAVIAPRLSNKSAPYNTSPLAKWYVAFGLLFLGQIIIATFSKNPLILEFAQMGVINVLKQGMFITLLFATVRNDRDLKILVLIILCCLAGREAWGLFRYLFLGGDPQNIYAYYDPNKTRDVKITFFDINDHILASLMLGFATWKLLIDRLGGRDKIIYAILAFMALLIPALSARRTAQGGILISMVFLYFLLPKGKRFPIAIIFAIALPLAFASLSLRSDDKSKSLSEKILMDVKTDENSDPRSSRFYELETAWQTVKVEPFFGVGPSGQFKVTDPTGLSYHKGNYGFVHSGLGHILLKTGFVGLFIFLGIFVTFIKQVISNWHIILPKHKALVIGCLCGFFAQLPNLFMGAPVIEIRTMLVSGFLFAIPLICIELAKKQMHAKNVENFDSHANLSYFTSTRKK